MEKNDLEPIRFQHKEWDLSEDWENSVDWKELAKKSYDIDIDYFKGAVIIDDCGSKWEISQGRLVLLEVGGLEHKIVGRRLLRTFGKNGYIKNNTKYIIKGIELNCIFSGYEYEFLLDFKFEHEWFFIRIPYNIYVIIKEDSEVFARDKTIDKIFLD